MFAYTEFFLALYLRRKTLCEVRYCAAEWVVFSAVTSRRTQKPFKWNALVPMLCRHQEYINCPRVDERWDWRSLDLILHIDWTQGSCCLHSGGTFVEWFTYLERFFKSNWGSSLIIIDYKTKKILYNESYICFEKILYCIQVGSIVRKAIASTTGIP